VKHDDDHRPDHADRERRPHRRLVLPYGLAMWALWPVREVLGNRETPPPCHHGRAGTACAAQHARELPHFAALVLVVNAAGLANDQTGLGATLFFWARLVHAVVYITGIWWLRAPAYFAGVAGECLILLRLL